ncbi:MAG TPA: sodium:solute symporter family protein, partial [Comamonas sp.]
KTIELLCSVIIIFSYLGWVAAQVTALGLVFNLLTGGAMSLVTGMVLGTLIVLVYTLFGGMWSVAITDLVQMIVICLGLAAIAWFAGDLAGGADKVIDYAVAEGKMQFFPVDADATTWLFFFAAAITMMLGSIPQQDVFQRVMSSKDENVARLGPIIGGALYICFAFIPMFVVTAAVLIMPEATQALMDDDPQKILPTLVMEHMPVALQIAFFGALLSAIMSTASATMLAPSTSFVENVLRNIKPGMSDAQTLKAMRVTVVVFTICVLVYAISMQDSSIYEMVAGAYQVPLVGAFVPLVCGLYWKRATTQGALLAVTLGLGVWLAFIFMPGWADAFPQQLAGLIAAFAGMIFGSLAPQFIPNQQGHVMHYQGTKAE